MRRMTPVVVGVTLLAGCAQLAGIDETSGPATPDRASVTIDRVSVGATVVVNPMDLSANTAQFLVPDDAEPDGLRHVDAALVTPDTWAADVEGAPPLVYDLPDYPQPIKRLNDLGVRNVFSPWVVLEHPNPEPAPANAMLTLRANLPSAYAAGESFQLVTLGAWNQRGIPGADLPVVGDMVLGPVTFAYSAMTSVTGRPHEKITTADAVMFLRYAGGKLTGVMEAAPFEQTGTDSIMGTMTAVPANQTLDIMVGPPSAVAARYAPARPAVPNLSMAWYLHAAPGAQYALDNGPLLTSAGVGMADPGTITATYGNPFVAKGWATTLTWSTTASRSYTPAGQMLPATLSAGLYQVVAPTPGLVLDLPAGLPEVITIDGKPLSTDGLMITQPTKPVHVSFVAGITSNTAYALNLYELVPNAGGTALVQKFVIAATGSKSEFTLPPDLLVPGKIYNLRAHCIQGGFPKIAEGDLRERSLPLAAGYLDSGVFTVVP